jgi:hypothetical protein
MSEPTSSEPGGPRADPGAVDGRRIILIRYLAQEPTAETVPPALLRAIERIGFEQADLVAHRSLDSLRCCAYLLSAPDRRSVADEAFGRLREALAAALPSASAARLLALMEVDGACASAVPTHHYVVETDVVATAEADLNAWYDQEHMPGLAAVPGSVRAARYRNLDDGPRYHACYELASQQTFGSAAWLQVRATEWSSRVRPTFLNTRRTMYRTLAGLTAA